VSTTIDEKSRMPVIQAVAACVGVVGIVMWLNGQFGQVHDRINETDKSIVVVGARLSRIEEILTRNVTESEVQAWTYQFQAQNPTIPIPVFRK
jgi:hypothetical protein